MLFVTCIMILMCIHSHLCKNQAVPLLSLQAANLLVYLPVPTAHAVVVYSKLNPLLPISVASLAFVM